MAPDLYVIRHCESSGPQPEAPLTHVGFAQARDLGEQLAGLGIRRIVSSPYRRALQSIEPLATSLGLVVGQEPRLAERDIEWIPDLAEWVDLVQKTFLDLDLVVGNGESSRAAQTRGLAAVHHTLLDGVFPTAIVGHGQLLSLVLAALTNQDPFPIWRGLTNPDIFTLARVGSKFELARIWLG